MQEPIPLYSVKILAWKVLYHANFNPYVKIYGIIWTSICRLVVLVAYERHFSQLGHEKNQDSLACSGLEGVLIDEKIVWKSHNFAYFQIVKKDSFVYRFRMMFLMFSLPAQAFKIQPLDIWSIFMFQIQWVTKMPALGCAIMLLLFLFSDYPFVSSFQNKVCVKFWELELYLTFLWISHIRRDLINSGCYVIRAPWQFLSSILIF